MIIIIEGPDGAGKSTLAHNISKQTGLPIIHNSYPKSSKEGLEMKIMYEEMIQLHSEIGCIMDRAWYSEMVYGPEVRGVSYITEEQMLSLEEQIALQGGGMIIHCTEKVDILWERCAERGEEYIKEFVTLSTVKHFFEHLMHGVRHIIPVVRHERNNKNL